MPSLSPDALLRLLLWILAALTLQFFLVIALGGWVQVRRNRLNRLRIACHKRWEGQIVDFLFGAGESACFAGMSAQTRRLFIPFLLKVLGTIAGSESDRIRELYREMGLYQGLDLRLGSRRPNVRALAALEVGTFRLEKHYPRLLVLLRDPVPHVAHAAARGLAGTGRMDFAGPVLDWVLVQEVFQQERLLWILEAFGLEILPWLEGRLAALPRDPRECMIFALLAASLRELRDISLLEAMLAMPGLEVQTAAIKALGALGIEQGLPAVLPFAEDPSWVLRAQATKAIGALAGPGGIPRLLDLLCDPVFDVRRNAAYALYHLGPSGTAALEWVAGDASADPFARDLALERLQWLTPGGSR